ncbi:hypothetical protein BLNAU_10153 [Blattamonas nauphoetae]|uniref:Uncharacterized protein n=1 Tax=Blattamonas nauphoetae TaxID=2049346 RepID=A0ABQ9XTL3_9EUKA|nr:hypothetical protein BLNAU_10153 [Blattamonas nauphoetae]
MLTRGCVLAVLPANDLSSLPKQTTLLFPERRHEIQCPSPSRPFNANFFTTLRPSSNSINILFLSSPHAFRTSLLSLSRHTTRPLPTRPPTTPFLPSRLRLSPQLPTSSYQLVLSSSSHRIAGTTKGSNCRVHIFP